VELVERKFMGLEVDQDGQGMRIFLNASSLWGEWKVAWAQGRCQKKGYLADYN